MRRRDSPPGTAVAPLRRRPPPRPPCPPSGCSWPARPSRCHRPSCWMSAPAAAVVWMWRAAAGAAAPSTPRHPHRWRRRCCRRGRRGGGSRGIAPPDGIPRTPWLCRTVVRRPGITTRPPHVLDTFDVRSRCGGFLLLSRRHSWYTVASIKMWHLRSADIKWSYVRNEKIRHT